MDAQDDSAAEFEFDDRTGGSGLVVVDSKFELEECRWLGRARVADGGRSPPFHERLIGEFALTAEVRRASVVLPKIPDNTGLLVVGVSSA